MVVPDINEGLLRQLTFAATSLGGLVKSGGGGMKPPLPIHAYINCDKVWETVVTGLPCWYNSRVEQTVDPTHFMRLLNVGGVCSHEPRWFCNSASIKLSIPLLATRFASPLLGDSC
jgi:hypothetical protein